jgi:hypothetical protein
VFQFVIDLATGAERKMLRAADAKRILQRAAALTPKTKANVPSTERGFVLHYCEWQNFGFCFEPQGK